MIPPCPRTTPIRAATRPVRVLAAGGTIAMRGERAVPALDASELVEQLPQVAGFHLEAETRAVAAERPPDACPTRSTSPGARAKPPRPARASC